MFGLGIGTTVKIAAGLAVAALIAGAVWHYNTLRNERDAYMLQAAQEKQNHAITKQSFETYQEETQAMNEQRELSLAALDNARRAAVRRTKSLQAKLSKHDLNKLAAKKPELLQKQVNKATAEIFQQIEELSR